MSRNPEKYAFARGFFLLGKQRQILRHRPTLRWVLLIVALFLICATQFAIHQSNENTQEYSISNVGAKNQYHAYMLHYFGWHPVRVPHGADVEPTKESAQQMLDDFGSNLDVDQSYSQLATLSLLPDIWLGGDPRSPTYRTSSALGFTLALCLLYIAFWRCRYELLGLILVVFLSSDPLQIYEVHVRDNVNGWVITTMLLVAAINLRLLLCPWKMCAEQDNGLTLKLISLPIMSGVVIGAMQHIRSETVGPAVVAFLIYVFAPVLSTKKRLFLIICFILAILATSRSFDVYFFSMRAETSEQVEKLGGKTLDGMGYEMHHPLWHSIWAGLGDFDDTYGYMWSDEAPYSYARPILDKLKPFDANEQMHWQEDYKRIMRSKVLSDIASDPVWFARILVKRADRILFENAPVRFGFGNWAVEVVPAGYIPVSIMLAIFIIPIVLFRLYGYAVLGLLFCSSGIVSIAVTTSSGGQYFFMLHVLMAAIISAWILELSARAKGGVYTNGATRPQTSSSP